MTNRQLLLALAGLGVLNVLLILVMGLRESTNGARIAQLSSDLRTERDRHDEQYRELNTAFQKTHSDLAGVSRSLSKARAALEQNTRSLTATRRELKEVQHGLAFYRGKPWLNRPEMAEPWRAEVQALAGRLSRIEKTVQQTKPAPPPHSKDGKTVEDNQ
jgi:hypothetical protein